MDPLMRSEPASPGDFRRGWTLAVAAVVVVFLGLVVVAAAGVRGTDQYWYLADVTALVEDFSVKTQQLYPVVFEGELSWPRPFIHNTTPVYAAAPFGAVLGPYAGWIAANVLASLLAAALIFLTVRRGAGRGWAASAAIVYLILPVTFWQTSQVLSEAMMAALVALATWLFVVPRRSFGRMVALLAVAVLLFYARYNYVLLLAAVPLVFLIEHHRRPGVRVRASLLAVGALAAWLLGPLLLPQYYPHSVLGFINGALVDDVLFVVPEATVQPALVVRGLSEAVQAQFGVTRVWQALFFWPFNLALVAAWMLVPKSKTPLDQAALGALGFVLLLHLVTIILIENQFRYLLLTLPPLLVAFGLWLPRQRRIPARRLRLGLVALVLVSLAADAALAGYARADARRDAEIRQSIDSLADRWISPEAPVLVVQADAGHDEILLGYALRPRPVGFVHARRNTAAQAASYAERLDALWMLAPPGSALPGFAEVARLGRVAPPYDGLVLFRKTAQTSSQP